MPLRPRRRLRHQPVGRAGGLVVEEVRVTGWQVEIRLRVPLDDEPPNGGSRRRRTPKTPTPTPKSPDGRRHANQLSSHDGLRSANLAAFAFAGDVGADAEMDVNAAQANELGDA